MYVQTKLKITRGQWALLKDLPLAPNPGRVLLSREQHNAMYEIATANGAFMYGLLVAPGFGAVGAEGVLRELSITLREGFFEDLIETIREIKESSSGST